MRLLYPKRQMILSLLFKISFTISNAFPSQNTTCQIQENETYNCLEAFVKRSYDYQTIPSLNATTATFPSPAQMVYTLMNHYFTPPTKINHLKLCLSYATLLNCAGVSGFDNCLHQFLKNFTSDAMSTTMYININNFLNFICVDSYGELQTQFDCFSEKYSVQHEQPKPSTFADCMNKAYIADTSAEQSCKKPKAQTLCISEIFNSCGYTSKIAACQLTKLAISTDKDYFHCSQQLSCSSAHITIQYVINCFALFIIIILYGI